MAGDFEFVADGSVTSPQGFLAGSTYAGLKTYVEGVSDLGILLSTLPTSVAATFSTNKIISPSVTVSRQRVTHGAARGVVANSGCANCAVGEQGITDAEEMARLAAEHIGVEANEILVASTGVIGVELPMALIRQGIPKVELSAEGGKALAQAIMTTDSRPKHAAVAFESDGIKYHIGGVAKGVGMIHPNMATMLCFLTTDAPIMHGFLQSALSQAVDVSFNLIDVDGDQSTNDTVLLFSNGAAGGNQIMEDSPSGRLFVEALEHLSVHLAKELVRDGEGAERIFAVTVEGAVSVADARMAAREVASSSLVKAMVHGRDPNWGRIIMAVGKSGAEIQEQNIDIFINDIHIVHQGKVIPYYVDAVIGGMNVPEVRFKVDLGIGESSATAWGCDLTEEYVTFNSAYST
ncbi:bifunctional glutamate N-acetyltransferase/amino-acid acetyltransferase ArgJ [Dehalococcoidia bacterium]|nr:bifunctional glutamate N-acetyltransferase/amino-acid acetyltransferase ArgJ [Dehalococcoidia bacterium]